MRRVPLLGYDEARRLGHEVVEPAHLLLVILRHEQGTAYKVLERLSVSAESLLTAIEAAIGTGQAVRQDESRSVARLGRVMEYAIREGRNLHHDAIGTGHLLLGILAEGHGPAAAVLQSHGVTLERARAEVRALIPPAPPKDDTQELHSPELVFVEARRPTWWNRLGHVLRGFRLGS